MQWDEIGIFQKSYAKWRVVIAFSFRIYLSWSLILTLLIFWRIEALVTSQNPGWNGKRNYFPVREGTLKRVGHIPIIFIYKSGIKQLLGWAINWGRLFWRTQIHLLDFFRIYMIIGIANEWEPGSRMITTKNIKSGMWGSKGMLEFFEKNNQIFKKRTNFCLENRVDSFWQWLHSMVIFSSMTRLL